MNWNIEQLSWNKVRIPGMASAISRIVFGNNIDILIILEVRLLQADAICTALVNALDTLAGASLYYYVLSNPTGGEHYAFIVRNMTMIRPLQFAPNPNAQNPPDGTQNLPFTDLTQLEWTTWPVSFPTAPQRPLPALPRIGLTDLFSTRRNSRGPKASRIAFAGQPIGLAGYSQGRGYRMPCLAMFGIAGTAGTYLIPIVCCHYAAVQGGRNILAQGQIAQLKALHIAQLLSFGDINANPIVFQAGYIQADIPTGAAPNTGYLVQNLIIMGDFNLDFMQNQPNGTNLEVSNHAALLGLTPTVQFGHSSAPPAAAGAAPAGNPPAVPFTAFNPGPISFDILPQSLRAAVTAEGTHLLHYDPILHPVNTDYLRDAAFDNFFYGGTEVTNMAPTAGDSGEVIDVPAMIEPSGTVGNAPEIEVSGLQNHYALANTKNANAAPNLAVANPVGGLTVDDMWIGARLVSDHLPVIIEFTCP